jgi:hypothetical protein
MSRTDNAHMLHWESDFDTACQRSLEERKPVFIDVMKVP